MFKRRIIQRFSLHPRLWAGAAAGLLPLAALAFLLARPSPTAEASPDTPVCGSVTTDTTWIAANNPYSVTCDVQVMSGVTLTIQSGVMVKFSAGTSLRVDGTLIAQGATFTSGKATPAKGDWGHIFFTTTSVDAVFDSGGNYLNGSIIRDSLIEWGGGGASVSGAIETASASPFISRNTIRNNGDSGIHAVGRSANQLVVISRNSVTDNSTDGNGGGLYVSSGYVISNTVENNLTAFASGDNGGGVYASNSTLINNTINSNSAYNYGGGIYATGSTLTSNTVTGNNASGELGGGIYASGGAVMSNTVNGNTVSGFFDSKGGGVYASGGAVTGNTVAGNTLYSSAGAVSGGGIYASLSMVSDNLVNANIANGSRNALGGGIYASSSTITGDTVTGNTANAYSGYTSYGGGVYADGGMVTNNMISNNAASGGSDSRGGGVYGDLVALQQNVLTGNIANQGGASYSYQGTATANLVLTNTTALSGTMYIYQGTATQNIVQGNTATHGGGLYAHNANLTGNTVQNNTANLSGGGIYATNASTLNGNTVMSNTAQGDGGGIYANGGTVSNNTASYNMVPAFGRGSGIYLAGNPGVSNNSVLSNTATGGTAGGVSINGQPQFQYNNLYGNLPYDAEVITSTVVTGTLNYWGSSPCTAIPAQIYDGNDAPGRGKLVYAPSLYSPSPLVPLAAPTGLTIVTSTTAVTLTWAGIPALPDAGCTGAGSTGPDASYRVYYDADGCPPYDGQGLPQGNSPIDASPATTIVLSGLSGGEYHFVVAAHDYLGRESAYSNEVVKPSDEEKIYLPLIRRPI